MDDVRDCKRYILKHKGQDIYLIHGEDFVECKFAFENREDRRDERDLVAAVCEKITEIRQEEIYKNEISHYELGE